MKKSLNPFVAALIGLFVGGLLVFIYFKYLSYNNNMGFIATASKPKDAKKMIEDLHTKLRDGSISDIPSLFARSYSLELKDIIALIGTNTNPLSTTKIRLYPGLRYDTKLQKDVLSFVVMIEKNGVMQWDDSLWSTDQNSIQDQWTLCPDECPRGDGTQNTDNKGKELLKESDWQRIMGKDYIPVK